MIRIVTLLKGFTLRGYRSFPSDQPAVLFPLRKVNLIAGQNNAGKSNILRVIADTYGNESTALSTWDRPLSDAEHTFSRFELHHIEDVLTWGDVGLLSAERQEQIRSFLRLPGIAFPEPGSEVIRVGVLEKAASTVKLWN